MGAPAQLRRLTALTHEALHGPRVHKFVTLLLDFRLLRVALGDVDHLDAELASQLRPLLSRERRRGVAAGRVLQSVSTRQATASGTQS